MNAYSKFARNVDIALSNPAIAYDWDVAEAVEEGLVNEALMLIEIGALSAKDAKWYINYIVRTIAAKFKR